MEEFKSYKSVNESDKKLFKILRLEEYLFAVLIILSLIGIAVTNYSDKHVLKYWLVMVPVFATVCIYYGWLYENKNSRDKSNIIKNEILQWIGLLVAVIVVLLLANSGNIKSSNAGYFIIILLSLSTYISGIKHDKRLIILATLLGLTVGVASVVEHIFWIMLMVAILYGTYVIYFKKKSI